MNNRTDETKNQKCVLSTKESLAIGLFTGAVETSINLPLWTIKTRAQCDLPFTVNPTILYRGFVPSVCTMSAFMSMQMVNSSFAEKGISSDKTHITSNQRIISAFIGGAIPSVIFCPLDLIITQYHKHNYKSYSETVMKTVGKVGARGLFAGLFATAITDGNYALWYWGLFPHLKKQLQEKQYSSTASILISGITAGLGATALVHSIDMVKTQQQKLVDEVSPENKKQNSFLNRLNELRSKKHGVGLWKAVGHRAVWLTGSITSAALIAEATENYALSKRK